MRAPCLHTSAAVLVAALLFAPTAHGEPTVLFFDDLGLPDDTIFSDQYADWGVIFSPQDGQLELHTATIPIFPDDPQGLAELPYFSSAIIMDFEFPAVSAGAWIDFGAVGLGVIIEAFDGPGATGNLLASATTLEEAFLAVEVDGISSVRFQKVPSEEATSFLIDHVTFELVPEPGTATVVALGGLALVRRRSAGPPA